MHFFRFRFIRGSTQCVTSNSASTRDKIEKKKSVTRTRNRKKTIPIDGAPDFREILVYRVVNAANLVAEAKLQRNAVYVELCGYFSFSRKLLFSFYFSLAGGMATRCYFRSILILLQTRIEARCRTG